MEQIIQLLLEMDPSLISSYVNYFFIAIAAIGVIGFLIGFIKGMYKELTTLVITILYLAFVIFANKLLTNALAEAYQPDTALAINPITQINPYGYCIWGNRTLVDNSLKQGTTATSFLNIRNLCSDIKKQLYVACQSLMFEQNTDILWINFLALVTPLLDQMVSGYGITNYKIIKLPPSDRTKINVKIRIYPIYAVESFDITLYINDQGAYMDEE